VLLSIIVSRPKSVSKCVEAYRPRKNIAGYQTAQLNQFLLMLSEIFKGYARRHGDYYCKFSLQTEEYDKRHCILRNNC